MALILRARHFMGTILASWRRWRVERSLVVKVENLVRLTLVAWLLYLAFAADGSPVIGYTLIALVLLAGVRLGKDTLFRRLVRRYRTLGVGRSVRRQWKR